MASKNPKDSLTISTNLVMPNDTNQLHTLFGGQLLAWMDEVASICAFRHCNNVAVTAAINNVSFDLPILNGSYVTLESTVSRTFRSSMEIFVDVYVENRMGKKEKCNEAIFTFVAIDEHKRPLPVPEIIPETELEKERFNSALRRRQLSLVLAGRMNPKDATELRSIFLVEEK